MKTMVCALIFLLAFSVSALEENQIAPNVVLTDMGTEIETDIIIPSEGKSFVVLEFMSITCGPCIKSLPFLRFLNNEISENADLRMVDIDRPSQAVTDFFEGYYSLYFDFPFYGDTEARIAAKAFKIKYTPTLFVIDNSGNVVYKHVGTIDTAASNHIRDLVNN